VARFLGLPMWSTGGCTDAKTVDEQAAIEGALSIAMAGLSGANLVHDVGFIDSALTGSLSMLVMCDEIIGMVERVLRGMEVNEETLAVELIDAVGPGGKFIAEDHTLDHFRRECFFPKLVSRANVSNWQAAGAKTMGQRVEEKVKEILATHHPPPLPPEVKAQFEQILSAAVARTEGRSK
jgi:trimethylamine--corrinoid protein Co-methyltransferase